MKFNKCSKCWREYIWAYCPNWCNSVKQEEKIFTEKIEIKKEIIPDIPKEEIKEVKTNIKLPIYSSSYLHNKLNKNINSIKKEKCCIKVWEDKYILHSDIIKLYKDSLI